MDDSLNVWSFRSDDDSVMDSSLRLVDTILGYVSLIHLSDTTVLQKLAGFTSCVG